MSEPKEDMTAAWKAAELRTYAALSSDPSPADEARRLERGAEERSSEGEISTAAMRQYADLQEQLGRQAAELLRATADEIDRLRRSE